MRVFLTGATGFVGSHIAAKLIESGHEVRILIRAASNRRFLPNGRFEEFQGDVTDLASLRPALRGVAAVVHAAGLVKARSVREFHSVNVAGTANVLAAAAEESPDLLRFVYLSSLAAHGPSPDGSPRPLNAISTPVSAYGRSKSQGEGLVRDSPFSDRSAVLRLPVVYGPKDLALLTFFRLVKWRLAPLLQGGRNVISTIYVDDAARAASCLATTARQVDGKAYTADDGSRYDWRSLLGYIESAMERRALLLPAPLWLYQAAALAGESFSGLAGKAAPLSLDKVAEMRQHFWVCSNQAIEDDLGWRPAVTFPEGAKLTAAWYRAHRLI